MRNAKKGTRAHDPRDAWCEKKGRAKLLVQQPASPVTGNPADQARLPRMLAVQNATKRFGDKVVLDAVTHAFVRKGTTALIGPSGSGKSTLLRALVGLVALDAGQVIVGDRALTPATMMSIRRSIGYVIQDGGLFPHLTAAANVALLSCHMGLDERAIASRMGELAELTQLSETALRSFPAQLSGGQKQRVALMRALMLNPAVLLLDEPLGALDPIIRFELQEQLRAIFARLEQTVVLVTHDMSEAHFFANEIVLMNGGRIVQKGTVETFLASPASPFVTQFLQAQRTLPMGAG